MRTSTLKLSILAFILCLSFSSNAQQTSYYNYNYPWTFGINGGLAWQYSDVNGGAGYGLGIDLAKRLGGNEGSWFALDARGRLSFLRHYGQGSERFYDLNNSDFSALSPFRVDNGGVGYAFHNHQTTMGELDLEGVITLNRLRERTGWTVQLFGGIGIGLYDVTTDLDNGSGFYDYSIIDTTQSRSRSQIRRDIRDLRNRTYEASASGFEDGIRGTIMPSLGLGVGYQFTPRFSLGLEHKGTWTQADNLDGVIDQSSNRPDDVHHYTSLYMRWTLGEKKGREPIIDVTAPNRSPYTTQVATGSIRANIRNVSRRSGVTVRLNGQRIDYFDFNTATEEFFLTAPLVQGQNTVTINAQNDYGSDEESVVFIYEYRNPNPNPRPNPNPNPNPTPAQNPPVVEMTSPRNCPFTTNSNTVQIEATVRNVSNKNDVQFTVNGNNINDFRLSRNKVTATVNLQNGNNYIEITGRNDRGQVNDNCTIIYNQPELPRITFLSPTRSPYTVTEDDYSVRARIENVDNNKNIELRVNGKSEPFSFKNGELGSLIDLNVGANTVEISAYNDAGTDEASTIIVFEKQNQPAPAPNVNITSPSKNPQNTDNSTISIKANTSNVDNKGQITFKVNGSNKAFNFKNGQINATVNLVEGNNRVDILVNTNGGKANDFVNIIYKKSTPPVSNPPKVTIKTPNTNPYTSKISSTLVTATVTGVTNKSDIRFVINGQSISKFSYSTGSNLLKATVNLKQGSNTFEIIATNNGGTDKADGTVVYKPETKKQPPVITMLNPTNNPHTTTSGIVNLKAKVQYISGRNDVTLKVGGVTNNSFSYKNGIVALQLDVPKAGTTVEITATNVDGQDKESVKLLYKGQPTVQKPVIKITRPAKSPYTSVKPSYRVEATVTNVTDKNNITVKIGSKSIRNFTYTNNIVKVLLTIPSGGTTVQITAENTGGSDTKSVRLNYNKPKQPPVITMITPKKSPYTSTTSIITLKAKIQYIRSRNDISVTINGQSNSGFTFSGETLTMPMDIAKNGSTVVITATNADGQDKETVVINYNKPVVKPTVKFTNPSRSPFVAKGQNFTVYATVTGVTAKNNVTVKVDGKGMTNFKYSAGKITIPLKLKNGSTRVDVTANNNDGSDTKSVVLNYTQPKQPPVITMITPKKSPYVASSPIMTMKAKVQYVSGRNNIQVTINGQSYSGFTFSGETFTMPMDIAKNGSTVVITATNADGQDKETVKVTYTIPVPKPTVTIRVPEKTVVNTTNATEKLTVIATNTTSKNQVKIKVNNVNFTNFAYNNGIVTANLPVKVGKNTVLITVENSGGKASKTLTINRSNATVKPSQNNVATAKPTINYLSPKKNGVVITNSDFAVRAKVTGITSKANVTVKVNGKLVKSFTYSSKKQIVRVKDGLVNGKNTIIIVAKNAKGVTTKSTTFTLKATVSKEPSDN
ncbi:MAG: hypothetical protein AB8G11_11550 [Saprospiraceae bacterium]